MLGCTKDASLQEMHIEEVKYNKSIILLKFKGIDTIEEAETYRNLYLKIDRENAVELPENSYFIVDLLECSVYTEEDELLGKLDNVFPTGSNDVYVVKNEDRKANFNSRN